MLHRKKEATGVVAGEGEDLAAGDDGKSLHKVESQSGFVSRLRFLRNFVIFSTVRVLSFVRLTSRTVYRLAHL